MMDGLLNGYFICLRRRFSIPTVSTVLRRCLRPLHSFLVAYVIAKDYCFFRRGQGDHGVLLRGRRLHVRGIVGRCRTLGDRLGPRVLFGSLGALCLLVQRSPSGTHRCLRRLSQIVHCALRSGRSRSIALHRRVRFMRSCVCLLRIHCRRGLRFSVHVRPRLVSQGLPPVTLRLLIRGTIGRGRVDGHHPLAISIVTRNSAIRIDGPLRPGQKKDTKVNVKLTGLTGHCRLLCGGSVVMGRRGRHFAIVLPLV